MRKINVLDDLERQKTQSWIKGFDIGRNNTVSQIIREHESGMSLKSIYKLLKKIQKDINENNSKRV